MIIGAISVGACLIVAWRASKHIIEAALTTIAAFGSFYLAEQLHVSGVLPPSRQAFVTTGFIMGNLGMARG